MHVVSVMNYKGGVGKTTLTANLAAEIANKGYRVLVIDLDPQANLTFSFFSVEEWTDELRESRTIKRWYDGEVPGEEASLDQLVLTPERVNERVKENAGQLDLIASHLGLIDIDLHLANRLGGTSLAEAKRRFLQVHGCLAQALKAPAFSDYDVILIDCAPNFGLVTKTAIVASDWILVPAKPDYLSTLGIAYLSGSVEKLVGEYNDYVSHGADRDAHRAVSPQFAGVVFTMTQIHSGKPILLQRAQMAELREVDVMPIFQSSIRNSPRYFGEAGRSGIPAILQGTIDDPVSAEIRSLTEEFAELLAGREVAR
ncbi:MAG TPA: AAA family ATPase [Actinoplanes sp.]|nr:AAA family ATPase [Actinoplanes sp.]